MLSFMGWMMIGIASQSPASEKSAHRTSINLVIEMNQLPKKSGRLRARLPGQIEKSAFDENGNQFFQKPWSAHWWPYREGQLWKWSDSPLKIYDLYRRSRGRQGSAAKFESQAYETQKNQGGYRDAWAKAAVFMPAPKRPVQMLIDNEVVEFSIADIQALLIHTFSEIPKDLQEIQEQTDAIQFFSLVKQFQEQNKKIFWMDWNPSEEVWMVPVYSSLYILEEIPNRSDAVKLRISVDFMECINDWEDRDSKDSHDRSLDYYAILSGVRDGDKLKIESGTWTKATGGDSTVNHPDSFFTIKNSGEYIKKRKSSNPYIDIDLVDEIAARSY